MPKIRGSVILVILILLGSLAAVRHTPESLAAPRPTFGPFPTIPIVATRVPPLSGILRANDDSYLVNDEGGPTIFLANAKANDGTSSCKGTLIVFSSENSNFQIQIDDVGNIFFTDSGTERNFQTTYYLRCSTFDPTTSRFIVTTSNTATVHVHVIRPVPLTPSPSAQPSLSATATRPARTPTPFPTIRIPTRTPVGGVTPRPTIIIRFTPTPAVTQFPTIRPIGTIRPTRPANSPTASPRL